MVIYADLVFLANFFGDFLCLWVCSAFYRKIPLLRRILLAILGGVYGTVIAVVGISFADNLLAKVILSIPLGAAAYMPASLKEIARGAAAFFVSAFVLSGAVLLADISGSTARKMLALFGVACIIVSLIYALKSRIYARYMPCELVCEKRRVRYLGFYDSGNRLVSEKDGECVIVADERIIKKLFPIPPPSERFAEIPFSSCAKGVMKGIKLDYAKVDGRIYEDVVLAISETRLADSLVLHSTMV